MSPPCRSGFFNGYSYGRLFTKFFMTSNTIIRNEILAKRNAISASQQALAAQAATEYLIKSPFFLSSQSIACYLPVRNELNTHELIEHIWQSGKKCYLPVIEKSRPGWMSFALYCPNDVLIPNEFGILEPVETAPRISEQALDLVITPLVAYDSCGNRLGSGCGYYDRVFANIQDWSKAPKLCGFAYHQQQVPTLYPESWDVPLHAVVTDKNFVFFTEK
jgi:5-formyltetrahydrofolate cyclo-ligase